MTGAATLGQVARPAPRAGTGSRTGYGVAVHQLLLTRPMPRLGNDVSCQHVDPELFFPNANPVDGDIRMTVAAARQAEAAKAVCTAGPCPALAACLEWAVEEGMQGIWGGTDEAERARMRRALRRNRRNR